MRKLKLDELRRPSAEEFKSKKKNPFVLVLDNIRSLHNVGSAFRTGDAFAVEHIYLCGITGKPPHREIHKTALGAEEVTDWTHAEDAGAVVKQLKKEGYVTIAVEQTDESVSLPEFVPERDKKYCFVFGNEVFGVSDEVLAEVDAAVEIPQFGTKHSFNVSVSMGIVLWDFWGKVGRGGITP